MRRMTYFVMALALVLGFTQCKKDEPQGSETEVKTVGITLKVDGNSGSKHDINTVSGSVTFQDGDVIYVGDGSHYIGTLTRTDGIFSGNINEPANNTEIYFYFVGGLTPSIYPLAGSTSSFTVDISDQSSQMPVLSCNCVTYKSSTSSYSCKLQNQCALVKFTTTSTSAPVHVGGLYTEAKIDFANNSITNNVTTGFIALKSANTTEKWAVLLPQTSFTGAECVIADKGYTILMPAIGADAFLTGDDAISFGSTSSLHRYLQWASGDLILEDGDHVYGTLAGEYKISIADGATVTLDNVTINGVDNSSYRWAGLTCLGDATIILADGTINTVKGFYKNNPGIQAAKRAGEGDEYTLTIQGTGTLDAKSNGYATGIGGGNGINCGNIIINGGTITATGGRHAAGIGCGGYGTSTCGDITINGGTIEATGGARGAGIGGSYNGTCGDITISNGEITAKGGVESHFCAAGIGGGGYNGNCNNITISGGVVTATGASGDSDGAAGIGGGYAGTCGAITISGGEVTAKGGDGTSVGGVGIGGGYNRACGDILISGGTISATGGYKAAGIGAGYYSTNGTITIQNTVTRVTATKGENAYNNIGVSVQNRGTCGTVTIGGEVGAITTSPYTYVPALDLSTVTSDITVTQSRVITGTLGTKAKISIADGVNVTLKNVDINGSNTWTNGNFPGLSCLGDVTITLEGTNVVKGLHSNYPGLNVVSGKTLTIRGSGSLNAIGDYGGAGIGAGWGLDCGNIRIEGGTITASSGAHASGIGGSVSANCGDITITGGSVTVTSGNESGAIGPGKGSCGNILISGGIVSATGGNYGAGIGTGQSGTCGTITITNGVTRVTATKGSYATNSIGQGHYGTCGTITIGGVITGNIPDSPYTYQP